MHPANAILKSGRLILSQKEVRFDAALKARLAERLSAEELRKVERMARKIRVVHMRYRSNGHAVVGFAVVPRANTGKLPCVIYNRGGYGEFGALKLYHIFTVLGMVASWGYVVIASQYSGNAGSEGKDEFGGKDVADVLALYNVLKLFPQADRSRIGMFGVSRGGMMTYLCLVKAKWIKAAATVGGVTNLMRNAAMRSEMNGVMREAFGGSLREKKKRSAIEWAGKLSKRAPLLLMHGTADWRVSPLDALDLSQQLLKNRVPYRLVMFEGADHGLHEHAQEANEFTRQWFDRFVKNRSAPPNLRPHGK